MTPWQPGVNISELNNLGGVANPSLTADELTILFASNNLAGGQGGYDIWTATREDKNSPFGNVTNLAEINSTAMDLHPYISPDGLSLYFASDRNGSYQLFKATRPSVNGPFVNLEHLSFLDSSGSYLLYPFLSSDSTVFYFVKGIQGDSSDIYVSYLIKDPYELAVINIEDAKAEKLEALERIAAALEKEWSGYDALEELLAGGDYGDLKKADITKAKREIHSATQRQERSKDTLAKSIENLQDALTALGWDPLTEGLVSHWKFDEGEDSIAYDSVGNNDGTIYGAAWTTGQVDGALDLDGVDDYVSIGNDSGINPTSGITISTWVKATDWTAGHRRILQKGLSDNQYRFYILGESLDLDLDGVTNGIIMTNLPSLNQWHHLVGTYDGSEIAIYIDGQKVASQAASGSINVTSDDLNIGVSRPGIAPAGDHFSGTIDEVRIYNKALSAEEIQQLYQDGLD